MKEKNGKLVSAIKELEKFKKKDGSLNTTDKNHLIATLNEVVETAIVVLGELG